jgi:hypothetical protein
MKYIALVYVDPSLLEQMPGEEFNRNMRGCLDKADEMTMAGTLRGFGQLEDPRTARTVRIRNGKRSVMDGPFAETKEVLGGFNILEADNIDEAMKLAENFPWAVTGSIEVRPMKDISAVRRAVGG